MGSGTSAECADGRADHSHAGALWSYFELFHARTAVAAVFTLPTSAIEFVFLNFDRRRMSRPSKL